MYFRPVGLALAAIVGLGAGAFGYDAVAPVPATFAGYDAVPVEPTAVTGQRGFYEQWVQDRLEMGLHFSVVALQSPNKWNDATGQGFVGTISHLDEEQSFWPYNLSIAYFLNPYFGIDLQWERLEAKAVTNTDDHHVDGTYKANGPSFLLVGRLPLEYGLAPYVEAGLNVPSVDFESEDWWRLGYLAPADYEPGSGKHYLGKTRYMDTDADGVACFTAALGMLWEFRDQWSLDLNLRYVDVNATSHHYSTEKNGDVNDHGDNPIPLAYMAFGAGVVYRF